MQSRPYQELIACGVTPRHHHTGPDLSQARQRVQLTPHARNRRGVDLLQDRCHTDTHTAARRHPKRTMICDVRNSTNASKRNRENASQHTVAATKGSWEGVRKLAAVRRPNQPLPLQWVVPHRDFHIGPGRAKLAPDARVPDGDRDCRSESCEHPRERCRLHRILVDDMNVMPTRPPESAPRDAPNLSDADLYGLPLKRRAPSHRRSRCVRSVGLHVAGLVQ